MADLTGSSADKVLYFLPRFLMAALIIFANNLRAEDVLLTVNVKKPVALTSDKFLSYTLDPTVVLTGDALTKNSERSVNMAKALAPAYVRIGGPRSNSYTFERTHGLQDEEDPGFTFTEANWIDAHRWAKNAGLDVLACIAPQHSESGGQDPGWDSRNALDLISFSDHMGFNTSWQLGYECQTRCDVAGIDIGRDVMRLRSMLDAFPRYSRSIIAGPDVVTYRTKQQQQYLQDYLNVAGTALSAITWHPDFASITLDTEGVSMHHDNLAVDRDGLYRVVGRLISKKPLWLAESKPEECKRQFLGALVWTRRLGNAAKLGVQVLMRQPNGSNLFQPTPDYWVSVLHKTLVGREVLDTKIATGNRTHVHFYCQCTKPSSRYEKGSLTIFGINLTPAKLVANLKGIKIKTLHKYILLPGFDAENRMFSETVLLNDEPLNLVNESELPEIKPSISSNSKGVTLKLPSGGIGFWVIPGLKIKSCGGLDEDNSDKMLLKKLTKRLDVAESDEESAIEEDREENEDEENNSGENRRHSLKSSKDKRRRKHRFSEEDDAERRYRKVEAKMDLEKLEKLLRRRDNYDERKLTRGRTAYFGFEEKSHEKMYDEDIEETGEEIRSKLEEYKNRLKDYENRRKNETKLRDRSKITESSDNETIDSEKVVEALTLISKMENAMKNFEKVNDEAPVDTLNPSVSYDVTSDLAYPGENRNPEDMFLDELLKSEKIKRTSVPSKIEVQLRAIYQMLAEEKERRQRNIAEASKVGIVSHIEEPLQEIDESLSRTRRDTEKKFGDDPLGLRKEGLYRRRPKNEEMRERRIERRTRRKDKDDRKDGQPVIFDPKTAVDSNENNFYGFHQREPLKGFPEGDVFLTTGTSSEETAKDYDYVRDDDDTQDQGRPRKIPKTIEKAKNQTDPDDTTWVEDENTQLDHVPHEFFENIKMAVPRVQENLKEYGELWEAESLGETQGDHQDHFNAGDEEATVEKVVHERRPDAHEDKRTKETTVRKLIGYYENPRSHPEEDTDYFDPEKTDKPQTGARNSPRITPSEIRNRKPNQESMATRKRVKDLASSEYGDFTDFDSMHFGRAAMSSMEDESLYSAGYPATRPAPRIRRTTDDLEKILDREMIFQDDNNLKDCECRAIRGTRAGRRRGDRERGERRNRPGRPERWQDEDRAARAERRRYRNRNGSPSPGPGGRFDEDYMHTTRSKRQVGSADEGVQEMIVVEPHVSIEYSSDESGSTLEDSESLETSNEANEHIESFQNEASQQAPNDTKGKAEIGGNMEEKVTDGVEKINDLAVEEENTNLSVENEAEDLEDDKIVKRHNEAETAVTEGTEIIDTEERKETKSAVLEDAVALPVTERSETEKPTETSVKDTKADQLFLDTEFNNVEKSSTTVDEASDMDTPSTTLGVDKFLQNLQTSSSEDEQTIVGLHSNGSEAKTEDYSTTTTSNPGEVVEEENEPTEQGVGEDSTVTATEDLKASILKNEDNEEGAANRRVKLEDKESSTYIPTTESDTVSSNKKIIPKRLKYTKDTPKTPRKPQKSKQTVKVVDPAKAREARLTARSEALAALRKENDARKAKKTLEATSKLLSSEHAKFQAIQKKRVEQLEKLRDKLRTKRAKMVQEYRDELLDELDKASNGEERNLKRREIIDMINHDDELRDIVDREKLDYLMLNKPINYETVKNEYNVDHAEQRKKYVPKMVEIVKPLHEVRERKVKPPSQPIRYASDPTILAYASSDEPTNSEAIRRALRERIDLSDHKVKRRSGKIYYSVVESLENPRIRQYPRLNEHESGEEVSNELSESVESEQALSRSSSSRIHYDEEEKEQNSHEKIEDVWEDQHYKDYRRQYKISESQEERDKSLSNSKYPPRLTRNTSNGMNQYMCRNKKSDENSNENQDKLFDVIKEKDHYMPVQGGKSSNHKKYISKKKYLKDSDYELNSKYKSPKYARLALEKMEVQREKLADSRKNLKDYQLKADDNDELLQEISLKNVRSTKENNDELELCSNEWMKEDQEQEQSDLEVIHDLDLDEALNSSKFDILMLIPVKNQKKSRPRRRAGNEIFRDQEDSVSNEIPVEMVFKNNAIDPLQEELVIEKISVTGTDHSEDSGQSTESIAVNDIDDANNSISESSTVLIVTSSNTPEVSVEQEGPMLGGYSVEEIVQSVPQIVTNKKFHDDNGLPALLQEAIPRLKATVDSGLGKARHISESFEKFVGGFEDQFNQKELEIEQKSIEPVTIVEKVPITCNIFSTATTNVRKFFDFLSGMINVFRFM